jgi:hypothetical protein
VLFQTVEYGAGTNASATSVTRIRLHELMHVTVRRSGLNVTFWLNGVLADSQVLSHAPEVSGPTQILRLGANDAGVTLAGAVFVVGSLCVIPSALTDAQILEDARGCLGWL